MSIKQLNWHKLILSYRVKTLKTMKEKEKSENTLDSENYKFFTGVTCENTKCHARFPKQIVLSDYNIQCPECGTKIEN